MSIGGLTAWLLPLLKWAGLALAVLFVLGLVVVRIAAGRLRVKAFGPGGGLKA